MDIISIRRNLMAQGTTQAGYVTDGLLLWMDGINKGNIENAWTSLVGEKVFTAQNGVSFLDDCIQLSSAGEQYLSSPNFDLPNAANGTIEVVCDFDLSQSSGIVFMPANGGDIAFGFNGGNSIIYKRAGDGSQMNVARTTTGTGSFSISSARKYINGVAVGNGSINAWSGNGSVAYIGRRDSSNKTYFNGKIYSIRVYNRYLTTKEILNNYRVDHRRFSLFRN